MTTEFSNCRELIEFLINTYEFPQLGQYLLNDDIITVTAVHFSYLMPCRCVVSPVYPRTVFFLQQEEDINGEIQFGLLVDEGVLDELTIVTLPKKYRDELYEAMITIQDRCNI